jgi:predicted alpha-1,6-mannanase (GH76 family)
MSDGAPAEVSWGERADRAQDALSRRFGARMVRGGMRNTAPVRPRHAFTFNYWWLAHVVEARIDAFDRTADAGRLRQAERTYAYLLRRNGRSLVNDYFDDMGWLAIAALRLSDASGTARYLADSRALWEHIRANGWGASATTGVAWRTQQPGYKNVPSTGTFAILSERLFERTGDARYADAADAALAWFDEAAIVDAETGLVYDGVNRIGDGRVDRDWIFSYNQGLYLGVLALAFDRTGDRAMLDRASRTAAGAIARLAPAGVVLSETADFDRPGGGDIGLFKGVLLRYAELLRERLPAGDDERMLAGLVRTATDALWRGLGSDLRASDEWGHPAPRVTYLSTQLSAVIATEARARLDA